MVHNNMLYETFVLACLWGKPTENKYCAEFMDTRGPYSSRQACKERAIEIANSAKVDISKRIQVQGVARCAWAVPSLKEIQSRGTAEPVPRDSFRP